MINILDKIEGKHLNLDNIIKYSCFVLMK